MSEWIKIQSKAQLYVTVYKKPTLNIKTWRKIHYANTSQEKAGVTMLILDKSRLENKENCQG